jgi:CO dehydrogenase/acetyl-CoA synthase beta subunit
MEQYVELFETPGYIERVKPDVLPEDLADFEAMEKLARAVQVLTPIFQNKTFVWTDEVAAELLEKVEEVDPTPKPVVEQHQGVHGNRLDQAAATNEPDSPALPTARTSPCPVSPVMNA